MQSTQSTRVIAMVSISSFGFHSSRSEVLLRRGVRNPPLTRSSSRSTLPIEANLFYRAGRIFRTNADSVVSALEDPEKLLDYTVREMQEDLHRMKTTSAGVVASKKRLEVKYLEASKIVEEWYSRAQLALERGDEDLAREALRRRKTHKDNANSIKKQLDYQSEAVQQMVQNTKELEARIQEARSRKDTLKARAQSAKASREVSEIVGSLSTTTSMAAFERMEEKVIQMEAQAEAVSGMIVNDDLEQRFAALEGGSLDRDLAELKSRPIKNEIDFELEELKRKVQK